MTDFLIKICGLTNVDDARRALDEGANALGVIFAPSSPRRVDLDVAREVVDMSQGRALSVGVFLDQTPSDILELIELSGVRAAQIYDFDDDTLATQLQDLEVELIDARRSAMGTRAWPSARFVHLDGPRPGSGEPHELNESYVASFVKPVIVAGGLRPSNVAQIISDLAPYGVDVASGVESSIGRKDATLVATFIEQARRAFEQIREDS